MSENMRSLSLLSWTQLAGIGSHRVGLQSDGSLWTWGYNNRGQLGLGDCESRFMPAQIPGMWIQIASGLMHSLALRSDGTLWVWGDNSRGQIGLDVDCALSPVQHPGHWVSIYAHEWQSLALRRDGKPMAWPSP